jgi:hypothetical protein
VEFSVPGHGSSTGHCQSYLNVFRQIVINRIGWWCHLGTSSRPATDIVIIWSVIGIGTLQPNGCESVWITTQKFDSWHSWLVSPNRVISTCMNRHLGPGNGSHHGGNDQDLLHVYITPWLVFTLTKKGSEEPF